jgi:hypothetical protein
MLDIPGQKPILDHMDIISGQEAASFCSDLSRVFISRMRFMRISYDTYSQLRIQSLRVAELLGDYLK